MIDIFAEKIRSFAEASKVLPGRPHCSTLARWASKGRNGFRLETVVVGGRRYTSIEALQRFFALLSEATPGQAQEPRTARARHDEQVERQLDAEGL